MKSMFTQNCVERRNKVKRWKRKNIEVDKDETERKERHMKGEHERERKE